MLLPPSEGKSAPKRGKAVSLDELAFADALTAPRQAALAALAALCAGPDEAAGAVLGLGPAQAADLARNRVLLTAPTVPAARLYTGVLFDHLDLAGLPPGATRRANRGILVASGLWGVLRLTDRVPAYRLAGGVTLPPLGALAGHWRAPLASALPGWVGRRLLLDLRSGIYAGAWRPVGDIAERTVTVRVTQGGRVVSHHNKATKGLLARALLCAAAEPRTPGELAQACKAAGFAAALAAPPRPGRPWELTIDE